MCTRVGELKNKYCQKKKTVTPNGEEKKKQNNYNQRDVAIFRLVSFFFCFYLLLHFCTFVFLFVLVCMHICVVCGCKKREK